MRLRICALAVNAPATAASRRFGFALDLDFVAARRDVDAEAILDRHEILVIFAE